MAIPGIIDGVQAQWLEGSSATTHTITITTNSTNEVLVLGVTNTALSPSNFFTVASVTGGGLTWAKYASGGVADGALIVSNPTAHAGMGVEVWWALAPSLLTGAVITVTMSGQPSRGFLSLYGVIGCATPSAPWDATAPTIATGTFSSAAPAVPHYTTTLRQTLPIMFFADSVDVGVLVNAPGSWGGIMSMGGTGGTYPQIDFTPYRKTIGIPGPDTPTAFGCDPRTATSLTASWNTIPLVLYPSHVNEAVTITSSGSTARIYIAILGALVGTPLGNTMSYQVEYWRDDNMTPSQFVTTSATTTILTSLDSGIDYDWHVRAQDSAGGNSSYSNDVLCPLVITPGKLAMDSVICTTTPMLSRNLIWLSWSNDRGHSYGNPVSQSIGEIGEYRTSLQWQRLEYSRDRVFKLEWSAPMPTALQGCWVDVTPAQS